MECQECYGVLWSVMECYEVLVSQAQQKNVKDKERSYWPQP